MISDIKLEGNYKMYNPSLEIIKKASPRLLAVAGVSAMRKYGLDPKKYRPSDDLEKNYAWMKEHLVDVAGEITILTFRKEHDFLIKKDFTSGNNIWGKWVGES